MFALLLDLYEFYKLTKKSELMCLERRFLEMAVPFFTFMSVETLVLPIWLIIYRQKLSVELSFNY